jgi:hypothetical protein
MGKTGSMRNTHQRGIAIGPILYIVAILAVLVSAIAAGSGSFNGDISAISAKAYATAILEYANEVKLGVDRVIAKGCTDTQISFENPIVSGYTNPNAPANKSCHVFDVNGGGIVWKDPPEQAVDNSLSGHSNYGKYFFTSILSVKNIGNWQTTTSLIMMLPFTKIEIADKINELSNVNGVFGFNSLCNLSYSSAHFKGNYQPPCSGLGHQQYGMGGDANIAGHTSGCIKNSSDGWGQEEPFLEFNCFKVLIPR